MLESRAIQRYIGSSPRKMRLVIDLIRGKSVDEALSILHFSPKHPARVAEKILRSAVSNMHNKDEGARLETGEMFVKEAFSGLNPANRPHTRLFENKYKYDQMLVEKDITFYSHCEHHFVPIYGKVHVAYFSSGKVIGLSKINRFVQFFSKRPQVQERLTVQIGKELERVLNTTDVGVVIDANHMCVASRGVGDTNSKTGTAYFSGKFKDENTKREFLNYINTK